MIRTLLVFLWLTTNLSTLASVENLDSDYWIEYGTSNAPVKIVEYFSFGCPHCIEAFKEDFKKIFVNLIKPGYVHWTFHPVPTDLTTVKAMHCISRLNWIKKQIFLETTLPNLKGMSQKNLTKLMKRNMEALGRSAPRLSERSFIEKTRAFGDAYEFMQSSNRVEQVPTIQVNGQVLDDYPSYEKIATIVSQQIEVNLP